MKIPFCSNQAGIYPLSLDVTRHIRRVGAIQQWVQNTCWCGNSPQHKGGQFRQALCFRKYGVVCKGHSHFGDALCCHKTSRGEKCDGGVPQTTATPTTTTTTTTTSTTSTRATTSTTTTRPSTLDSVFWTKGGKGQNCSAVCGGPINCDEDAWPRSKQDFEKLIEKMGEKKCESVEQGRWAVNPAIYVEHQNACFWRAETLPGDRCSAEHAVVQRYCPCTARPSTTTTPAPSPSTGRRRRRRQSRRRKSVADGNRDVRANKRRRRRRALKAAAAAAAGAV